MKYLEYDSSNAEKPLSKLYFAFIILLINMLFIQSQGEEVQNIIIFNHKKFSAGTINKNGDLFIEYYSEENYYDLPNSILFYALSKEGRYYFSNESSYTLEKNIDIDETKDLMGYYNNFKIYDSKILFVTTKSDINTGKQYLFSINSYNSIVELHNFNDDANKDHYIWDFKDFFNLEDDENNFPYERELYELKGQSLYIIVFIPKILVTENFKDMIFIKKFTFKSFSEDAYEELKSLTFNNYINRINVAENPFKLIFNLINYNLQSANEFDINYNNFLENNKEYKYFKSIYLSKEYVMFAYYCLSCGWSSNQIFLELYKINPIYGVTKSVESIKSFGISRIFLADFAKFNDKKLVFISHNTIDNFNANDFNNILYIRIITIYQDYSNFDTLTLEFKLENYIIKTPISIFTYNGFILFTSNSMLKEDINKPENEINYFSIFMIFAYPNGTDSTIDISDFLNDNEVNPSYPNEFYNFLIKNYTIENNIGYWGDGRIKLVSIPDEIMIMEVNGDSQIKINNNSFMYREKAYMLKQNRDIIKTSKYYYIDYQYLDNVPGESYYGRTNRLKFKLCHNYCETCNELNTNDNDQKCLSCLPEYQYDYLYFQKINNNEILNCVPENHYLDENNIIPCEIENTKYYINTTNNKTICFSSDNNCPSLYTLYNEITKECFNCDFERFKNGECTKDDLTMESCTKCDYECFKIGGCNFNNFDTSNDDFYERIINGGYISNKDGNSNLKINNGNGYAFQIITVENELNNLKGNTKRNFSIIDLKGCIDLLRDKNNLNPNEDLILVKYENNAQVSNGNKKSIQYEVYLRNNTKLDLSVCSNTEINILN